LGDFNLHSARWGSDDDQGRNEREEAMNLVEWMEENGYGVLNRGEKTCVDRRTGRESVPDISWASREIADRCNWETTRELSSDHKPIIIELECNREGRRKQVIVSWAWRRAQWDEFREEMERKAVEMKEESISRMVKNEAILETAKKWISVKKFKRGIDRSGMMN